MKPTADDWKHIFNDLNIAMGMPVYDGPAEMPTDEYIDSLKMMGDETPTILRAYAQRQAAHRKNMCEMYDFRARSMWTMTGFALFLMIVTPLVIWIELAVNHYIGR